MNSDAPRNPCVQRGTALSLGEVRDGTLEGPYHGWRCAAGGPSARTVSSPKESAA
jgi:phenylpropionate dioxygenase-like ring-hydroxylating dioxygenase large terminal subunit